MKIWNSMKKNFSFFIIISSFIHVLVFLLISAYFKWNPPFPLIAIQVETPDKPLSSQSSSQIVDQYQFNHQSPDDNFYLSQHNNSTLMEQKGKQGKSQNTFPLQQYSTDESPMVMETSPQSTIIYSNIDDLENVDKEGDQNILNTKETQFYTFYSRVKHQIYWHWVRELKSKLEHTLFHHLSSLPSNRLITHTETIINAKGYPTSIIIKKNSGVLELDEASINAIRNAHPFLNPPSNLIRKDGTLRLQHSFVFVNQPRHHLSSSR